MTTMSDVEKCGGHFDNSGQYYPVTRIAPLPKEVEEAMAHVQEVLDNLYIFTRPSVFRKTESDLAVIRAALGKREAHITTLHQIVFKLLNYEKWPGHEKLSELCNYLRFLGVPVVGANDEEEKPLKNRLEE
jgi:hypothetical protein